MILSNCDRRILDGILLNDSFLWSSFNFRIPVRDLTVSRHHMVALLNDSSVYLYRHKYADDLCKIDSLKKQKIP